MGKFKQMQIDIDDDYVASIEDPYYEEEPDEKEETFISDHAIDMFKKMYGEKIVLCEHKAKLAFTRKVFVTYCEHCGKIFDVVKR